MSGEPSPFPCLPSRARWSTSESCSQHLVWPWAQCHSAVSGLPGGCCWCTFSLRCWEYLGSKGILGNNKNKDRLEWHGYLETMTDMCFWGLWQICTNMLCFLAASHSEASYTVLQLCKMMPKLLAKTLQVTTSVDASWLTVPTQVNNINIKNYNKKIMMIITTAAINKLINLAFC